METLFECDAGRFAGITGAIARSGRRNSARLWSRCFEAVDGRPGLRLAGRVGEYDVSAISNRSVERQFQGLIIGLEPFQQIASQIKTPSAIVSSLELSGLFGANKCRKGKASDHTCFITIVDGVFNDGLFDLNFLPHV